MVKLLDKVHGNEELNNILSAVQDGEEEDANNTLPRLQLAIEYKEKKVRGKNDNISSNGV